MGSARVYIYLLTISIVLSLCSPAIALEMSSKKNCAICHVMWLDDFRTDKETLIEWQSGNVLMKDTQGVDIHKALKEGYNSCRSALKQ
jgi:hypothetical protein